MRYQLANPGLLPRPAWRPARRRALGARLGQVDPRDEGTAIFGKFYDAWSADSTIAGRAQIEQDFLKTLQAKTTEYEQALEVARAQKPFPSGVIIDLRDRAAWLGVNLDNIWVNAPVPIDERLPYSPLRGLDWVAPTNDIRFRLKEVEDGAEGDLTKMVQEFEDRPWTETPHTPHSGAPQIPRPGEEHLDPGESGRRPRFGLLDDIIDFLKDYWWILPAGIAAYYLLPHLLGDDEEEEKKRERAPALAPPVAMVYRDPALFQQ